MYRTLPATPSFASPSWICAAFGCGGGPAARALNVMSEPTPARVTARSGFATIFRMGFAVWCAKAKTVDGGGPRGNQRRGSEGYKESMALAGEREPKATASSSARRREVYSRATVGRAFSSSYLAGEAA